MLMKEEKKNNPTPGPSLFYLANKPSTHSCKVIQQNILSSRTLRPAKYERKTGSVTTYCVFNFLKLKKKC